MVKRHLYPLRFKPVYKDYLWGGNRIISRYGRDEPPGVYAESWEVSDRDDGMSVVTNGELAGWTLHEVLEAWGTDLLGEGVARAASGRFPLLIKLIDARQRLSVQVHPNDETAAVFGGEAKTEMWYILDAEPDASVFAGMRAGTDRAAFDRAVAEGHFEDVLVTVPVAPGDAVFTPGGRVHAIDSGCLILEVQQNSNTTYRIHDWGRVGADGKPRELHLDRAREVILWEDEGAAKVVPRRIGMKGGSEGSEILHCTYFHLDRLHLRAPLNGSDRASFRVLFVAAGEVRLDGSGPAETLRAGDTCLVPAAIPEYVLNPTAGDAVVLSVTAPPYS